MQGINRKLQRRRKKKTKKSPKRKKNLKTAQELWNRLLQTQDLALAQAQEADQIRTQKAARIVAAATKVGTSTR